MNSLQAKSNLTAHYLKTDGLTLNKKVKKQKN